MVKIRRVSFSEEDEIHEFDPEMAIEETTVDENFTKDLENLEIEMETSGCKDRKWFITAYAPEGAELPKADAITLKADNNKTKIAWMIGQVETCPTTGKLHWQVVMYFVNKVTFEAPKKFWGGNVWHGIPRNLDASIAYCTKRKTRTSGWEPLEYGNVPKLKKEAASAERHRIIQAVGSREMTPYEAVMKYPNLLSMLNQLTKLESLSFKPRDMNGPMTQIVIEYGAAGVGKSQAPRLSFGQENVYPVPKTKGYQWWGGYRQQTCVLFDEFSWQDLSPKRLLELADRYDVQNETKGTQIQFNSPWIVICTNDDVATLWNEEFRLSPQFLRRLAGVRQWFADGSNVWHPPPYACLRKQVLEPGPGGVCNRIETPLFLEAPSAPSVSAVAQVF